ncbi:zinc finger protein 43-like [Aricia agestis]|uniref:zinc finger protein 43-like n=1 Tax=Aricia agestis TaxID=91739 RepID=UPI001C201FCF|nr:zinc finger protein 43-like [Aricia agestis]
MSDGYDDIQIEINLNKKCTCCLDNDGWRYMWERHAHNDTNEVYGEMIRDCFALSWDIRKQDMICEPCVLRVREAVKLKIEFVAVQELLKENFIPIDENLDDNNDKARIIEDPDEYLKVTDTYHASDHDTQSMNSSSESESISSNHPKRKRRKHLRSYRNYSTDDLKNAKKAILNKELPIHRAAEIYGIPKKTLQYKLNQNAEEKDEERYAMKEKNLKLYEEIRTIIRFTNAIPFKIKSGKYYCAYCPSHSPFFEDPEKLREHTTTEHRFEMVKLVEDILRPAYLNEVLRMEITDLKCNMCDLPLHDWNKMFIHLDDTHDIAFEEACARVIPFALNDDHRCALCGDTYTNFGVLDAHMNAHYCNYICYECGDPFVASSRLEQHLKIHKVGRYPCPDCGKVFKLEIYRTKHVDLVHEQRARVKCLYCPERFVGEHHRHRHVLQCHPAKVKVTTCEFCGKEFTLKRFYYEHLKKEHPRYMCSKCKLTFASKDEVKIHWIERARMNDHDHTQRCEVYATSIRPTKPSE